MASYVILRQRERPGIMYAQLVVELREKFECGRTSAEVGIQRAHEIRRANTEKLISDPTIIEDLYWELLEEAQRKGKTNDARRVLDSLRAHMGLGAPQRLELTRGKDAASKLANLTPEEIEALAAFDRAGDPSLVDADDAQDSTLPGVTAELSDDDLAALDAAGDAPNE